MITFFNANFDEFDATKNGGDATTQIESGVAHSFIKAVRAYTAEFGGERWFKFFIKSDIDIVNIGVDIAKPTLSDSEEVYIGLSNANYESEIDKDNFRAYGGFYVVGVDEANKKITADRDVSEFVKADDIVTFYDSDINRITAMKVDSVDGADITFKEWSDKTINVGYSGCSTLFFNSLDKDILQPIWLKQVIPAYTDTMEDPLNEFIINIWYDVK